MVELDEVGALGRPVDCTSLVAEAVFEEAVIEGPDDIAQVLGYS